MAVLAGHVAPDQAEPRNGAGVSGFRSHDLRADGDLRRVQQDLQGDSWSSDEDIRGAGKSGGSNGARGGPEGVDSRRGAGNAP